MDIGWLRGFVLCLGVGATVVTSAPAVLIAAEGDPIGVYGSVITVPAAGLIRKPANLFDLEGTTVTFTPDGAGGYSVRVGALAWEDPLSTMSWATREPVPAVNLPFAFPFAGRSWTRVYANLHGNISFLQPESKQRPHRDPWSSGTMRSVAAAIDSRSVAGLEAVIAVLWAHYGDTTISVDSTSSRVAITWRAVRPTPRNGWYEPLGENLFQARLHPSGVVEFAYRAVPERDGIVGLFHGRTASGRALDTVTDAVGDAGNAVLDITKAELVENGSTVLARMTVAGDVPERVPDGEVMYRFFLEAGGYRIDAGVKVSETGRRGFTGGTLAPRVLGYGVRGATIEIPISKTLLDDTDHLSWSADAVWWGRDLYDQLPEFRAVGLGESDHDLRAIPGTLAGNVFEVFHYPSFQKNAREVMSLVYRQVPDKDEIAVTFTDFRTDDLYSTGPGSGPINAPVMGIGRSMANPAPGEEYGSDSLLVTMVPLFIGAPNFIETGVDRDREFRDFGYVVRWIAHEAIHRWAAKLQFRNPQSGSIESLTDDGCQCHWSEWLHAPAVHAVGPRYSREPYAEASVMGGSVWLDNGDGTFTRAIDGNPLPTGLSALDLYVMGMIPPTQVPDTFLLRDVQETGTRGRVRATKVPVRIDDIIAAMGPRLPVADASRKGFRLGVYLLHEGGRPARADLLEPARALTTAITEYFVRATGGRMRVVPELVTVAEPVP